MLEENKDKTCLFFASDYHFEMITVPYITKSLKDNKIMIMTDNDLEESIKKVLSGINIDEKIKKQVLQIDWKNNDLEKINKIEQLDKQNQNTIIFIKGKEKYINNVNKEIRNKVKNEKIKIIDCFDINELEENIAEIVDKYDKILNMAGTVSIKNK